MVISLPELLPAEHLQTSNRLNKEELEDYINKSFKMVHIVISISM